MDAQADAPWSTHIFTVSLQPLSPFERKFEDVFSFLSFANFGVQICVQDFGHFAGDKCSEVLNHTSALADFQNLLDMRHKSALNWKKSPLCNLHWIPFKQQIGQSSACWVFCGQHGQLFPCGPNCWGIIVYYRCSWAAHDINQWHTADLPLWDAWDYILNPKHIIPRVISKGKV